MASDPGSRTITLPPELVQELDGVVAELREVRPEYSATTSTIAQAGIRMALEQMRKDLEHWKTTR